MHLFSHLRSLISDIDHAQRRLFEIQTGIRTTRSRPRA